MYSRKTIENNLILLALAGSRSYGTNTSESDWDWRGIMIRPSMRDYLRYEGFEQKDSGWHLETGNLLFLSEDTVVWDLQKYLKLANKANPNILEALWNTEYRVMHDVGAKLIQDRYMFLNRNVIKTYKGYAYAQLRKLENKNNEQQLTRKNDQKAGYRCKHAMHCLRLLYQLHYLVLDGELYLNINKFSKKRSDLLKQIKKGEVKLEYVQQTCEDLMTMLDESDFSEFPKPLSEQALSEYFIELLEMYYST